MEPAPGVLGSHTSWWACGAQPRARLALSCESACQSPCSPTLLSPSCSWDLCAVVDVVHFKREEIIYDPPVNFHHHWSLDWNWTTAIHEFGRILSDAASVS